MLYFEKPSWASYYSLLYSLFSIQLFIDINNCVRTILHYQYSTFLYINDYEKKRKKSETIIDKTRPDVNASSLIEFISLELKNTNSWFIS